MDKYFHASFDPFNKNEKINGDLNVALGNVISNVYVKWNWDGNTFTLTNDRYGIYPIYYFFENGHFAVSPSISKLLSLLPEIEFNYDALSSFLRLPWMIGDCTVFRSINAIPPGSQLTFTNGDLKFESAGILRSDPITINRKDAVATYAELFRNAINKTLPDNLDDDVIVPLSGGQDSRHILFELYKTGLRPKCVTAEFPPPFPNEDARVAKQICAELGLEYILIEQPNERFNTEISKNKKLGYCSTEHGWFQKMAENIKAAGFRHSYDGIAGDVLSARYPYNGAAHQMYDNQKFEELADHLLGAETYSTSFLTDEYAKLLSRDRAIAFLSIELKKHFEQADPMASFEFWNRTRRTIAPSPLRFLGDSINVVMPFLETELFDFLSSLPKEICMDGKFHGDTINYAFPQYQHIPYAYESSTPQIDNQNFVKLGRDIFKYSLSKRNANILRRTPLIIRCLRSVIDRGYSKVVSEFSDESIFLMQLERL